MPTPTKGPRLGGGPAHERLILANLATSLFEHRRITTTETKAKRLRPLAERLITFAKRGDLHARRRVLTVVQDKGVVHVLFTEIAPAVAERQGGYTRITKIGPRKGDNAPMAVIELVARAALAEAGRRQGGHQGRREGRAEGEGGAGRGQAVEDAPSRTPSSRTPPVEDAPAEDAPAERPGATPTRPDLDRPATARRPGTRVRPGPSSSSGRPASARRSLESVGMSLPVVLVHGLRTSRTMWRAQVEALERVGHGGLSRSTCPGTGTRIGEPFTLDARGGRGRRGDRRASAGGRSSSGCRSAGTSAIAHAARHPEQVAGLVAAACSTRPHRVLVAGWSVGGPGHRPAAGPRGAAQPVPRRPRAAARGCARTSARGRLRARRRRTTCCGEMTVRDAARGPRADRGAGVAGQRRVRPLPRRGAPVPARVPRRSAGRGAAARRTW